MRLSVFRPKPPITQVALKKLDFQLSDAAIKQIDKNIKKSIAKDDAPSKILGYIRKELSNKSISKYKFNQACYDLEKNYTESKKHWMFQQNLFCFFALIISIIWMCIQIVRLYDYDTLLASDCTQFVIYLLFTCLFLIVNFFCKKYKMVSLNMFLNQLNSYAPSAIMIGMTLCYLSLCLRCEVWISTFLIVISIFILLCSIAITLVKMCR